MFSALQKIYVKNDQLKAYTLLSPALISALVKLICWLKINEKLIKTLIKNLLKNIFPPPIKPKMGLMNLIQYTVISKKDILTRYILFKKN